MARNLCFVLAGRRYEVALERRDDEIVLGGQVDESALPEATARIREDGPAWMVHTDGRVRRAVVARTAEGAWVCVRGRSYYFERARRSQTPEGPAGDTTVRAPMTGTIIRLEVEPGQSVTRGDLVAVMEAMKMEYRLEAQVDGQVERIHCQAGDLLDVGAAVADLAPAT